MPILSPAVPVTPGTYDALPKEQQPVFFYRAPYAAFADYCEAFDQWHKREQSRALDADIAAAQEELEGCDTSTPAGRVRRAGLQSQIDDAISRRGRLPEPFSETEAIDAIAAMLGHVLLRVECSGESSTYPNDHTERVAWIKQWPTRAIAQLAYLIKAQAFRTEALGK